MLTRWKEETLRRRGYAVITLWECQWDERKKKEEPLSEWCEQLSLVGPLKQRDAFYGGRTGCTKLKSVLSNEETARDVDAINYFDFTSLYPSCNICRHCDERLESPVPGEKPKLEPTEPIRLIWIRILLDTQSSRATPNPITRNEGERGCLWISQKSMVTSSIPYCPQDSSIPYCHIDAMGN